MFDVMKFCKYRMLFLLRIFEKNDYIAMRFCINFINTILNQILQKYQNDMTKIFGIGVIVLTGARSLKRISLDLKLLAINGIVQATKISSLQGQSLITLSGFLSELPGVIEPELNELEDIAGRLSRVITVNSISVRRYMFYSLFMHRTFDEILADSESSIKSEHLNLSSMEVLSSIEKSSYLRNVDYLRKDNIKQMAEKIIAIQSNINDLLNTAISIINKAILKIERIHRNGFSANYMGSYISIESAYLTHNKKNFQGLVENIKKMFTELQDNLNIILDNINNGKRILLSLLN
jgi:hypothetical protein